MRTNCRCALPDPYQTSHVTWLFELPEDPIRNSEATIFGSLEIIPCESKWLNRAHELLVFHKSRALRTFIYLRGGAMLALLPSPPLVLLLAAFPEPPLPLLRVSTRIGVVCIIALARDETKSSTHTRTGQKETNASWRVSFILGTLKDKKKTYEQLRANTFEHETFMAIILSEQRLYSSEQQNQIFRRNQILNFYGQAAK